MVQFDSVTGKSGIAACEGGCWTAGALFLGTLDDKTWLHSRLSCTDGAQ